MSKAAVDVRIYRFLGTQLAEAMYQIRVRYIDINLYIVQDIYSVKVTQWH